MNKTTDSSCSINPENNKLAIHENEPGDTVIKLIGLGGAGGNIVNHMIRNGVNGIDFAVADTDRTALTRNLAKTLIQLDQIEPDVSNFLEDGLRTAIDAREGIAELLRGTHMIFIVAGLGGSTGMGYLPVFAKLARKVGIMTAAVVATPFDFKAASAEDVDEDIFALGADVDSLIVFRNDELTASIGEEVSVGSAFAAANDRLRVTISDIAEIINSPGFVNVELEDVRIVIRGTGTMATAKASGVDRARIAAEHVIASLHSNGIHLSQAKGVLVSIAAIRGLKLSEITAVLHAVREITAKNVHNVFGAFYDEGLGKDIRVTVVAVE